MGNEVPPPNLVIVAEPLCTSAQDSPLVIEVAAAQEAAPSQNYTPAPTTLLQEPLQSLWKQAQRFASAKDFLNPTEGKDSIPLSCSSVNISGSGGFGDQYVGSSVSHSIMVTNPCSCPVTYYIAGAPYGFTLSSSSGTISANGSTSFTVTFNPPNEGNFSGSISITPGGSSISLSGRGIRR